MVSPLSAQITFDGSQIDGTLGVQSNIGALSPANLFLIQPECTQRLKTEIGSFIITGRGGSKRLPGGYLPSVRLHRTN